MKSLSNWVNINIPKIEDEYNTHKNYYEYFEKGFHRDPHRPQFVNSNFFYSPADGTIIYQMEVEPNAKIVEVKGRNFTLRDLMQDQDYNQKALVIGVFMTAMDVHVNRMPYSGVLEFKHLDPIVTTNKSMLQLEKDIFNGKVNNNSMEYLFYNERVLNTVNIPSMGYKYHIIQIADLEVDVILHYCESGDDVLQNSRFGKIVYGSQVDLILPLPAPFDYQLLCKKLCHVEAGLDQLVKITPHKKVYREI